MLLVRNPRSAIRSAWNHSFRTSRAGRLDTDLGSPDFQAFALAETQKWEDLILDWVTLAPSLIVVHYELLQQDYEAELRRILHWLGRYKLLSLFQTRYVVTTGVSENPARLECVAHTSLDWMRRRKPHLAETPFSARTDARIEQALARADEVLALHGHPGLPVQLYGQPGYSAGTATPSPLNSEKI